MKAKATRCFMTFLALAALALVFWGRAGAYIMPAEQLVDMMASNFAKFKTLVITQSTHLRDPQNPDLEAWLEEKLWLKSPGLFLTERIDASKSELLLNEGAETGRPSSDMAFRRLLLSNKGEMIMTLLLEWGINPASVALTRLDGLIAYRIGDEGPEMPKLLIEKDRFIPLLLSYRLPEDAGNEIVNIRFGDYRKLASGWYPYEITYFIEKDVIERYHTIDVAVNVPIDDYPLSEIPVQAGRPLIWTFEKKKDASEQARLKEIINILKEKYD